MLDFGQVMEFADLSSNGLGASVLPTPWGARQTLGTHGLKPGSGPSFLSVTLSFALAQGGQAGEEKQGQSTEVVTPSPCSQDPERNAQELCGTLPL